MNAEGFARMYRLRLHGKGLLTGAMRATGGSGLGRGLGKGILGLALPAAVYLINDLTNPDGRVIPFVRRLLGKPSAENIVDVQYELLDDQETKQLNTTHGKEE
ncbi:MAG TPA: hypothetical protein ENN34_04925 [Deltaproteobacteria bacterium]|nr:hypothetical protein [Deltaproteobacteria bacterium]